MFYYIYVQYSLFVYEFKIENLLIYSYVCRYITRFFKILLTFFKFHVLFNIPI